MLPYYDVARFKEAAESLEKATSYNPTYAEAFAELGLVYLNLRQYKPAMDALQHAVDLASNDSKAQYHLGVAYLALGKKDKFWRQYALVKTLESDLAERLYNAFYQNQLLILTRKNEQHQP